MKRLTTFGSLAFALTLMPGCDRAGSSADAIKLIPDGANVMGRVDVKALVSSDLYKNNEEILAKDEANKEAMDALKTCNLGPDTWKGVVFGANGEEASKENVIVVEVTGIGKKENLECIGKKLEEKEGKAPWSMEEADGKITLKIDEDAVGYGVGDDMLVIATKAWADPVKGLIGGEGQTAVDGSLKALMGRVKQDHIWLVGEVPKQAEQIAGPVVSGGKDITLSLNLSDAVSIAASVAFESADVAEKQSKQMQEMYDGVKGFAKSYVSEETLDSVKFSAAGDVISVEAKITKADADALAKQAKDQ